MHTLYDDGRLMVTPSQISTPTRLYPLLNATVRLRNDPLWFGIAAVTFAGLAGVTYHDLLTSVELGTLASLSVFGLLAGSFTQIMALDAPGHPRVFIFGNRKRIRGAFNAIRKAKSLEYIRTSPVQADT